MESAKGEKVLTLLERITNTAEVRRNLDIDLFEEAMLDSLGLVELIAALSEELQIEIAPSEVERSLWSTPRKIVTFVESWNAAPQSA